MNIVIFFVRGGPYHILHIRDMNKEERGLGSNQTSRIMSDYVREYWNNILFIER